MESNHLRNTKLVWDEDFLQIPAAAAVDVLSLYRAAREEDGSYNVTPTDVSLAHARDPTFTRSLSHPRFLALSRAFSRSRALSLLHALSHTLSATCPPPPLSHTLTRLRSLLLFLDRTPL